MTDSSEIERLVNRFLAWPLPDTVASDLCITQPGNSLSVSRLGTNLLTAVEARQMIEYLLAETTTSITELFQDSKLTEGCWCEGGSRYCGC